jgi:hypothetical protein
MAYNDVELRTGISSHAANVFESVLRKSQTDAGVLYNLARNNRHDIIIRVKPGDYGFVAGAAGKTELLFRDADPIQLFGTHYVHFNERGFRDEAKKRKFKHVIYLFKPLVPNTGDAVAILCHEFGLHAAKDVPLLRMVIEEILYDDAHLRAKHGTNNVRDFLEHRAHAYGTDAAYNELVTLATAELNTVYHRRLRNHYNEFLAMVAKDKKVHRERQEEKDGILGLEEVIVQ